MDLALRPPELDIEGCTIHTNYGTGGRVVTITPCPGHPDWTVRPLMEGWTIEYRSERDDSLCYINEVFVEDGRIYAHPWRDQVEVVQQVERQMRLF